MTLVERAQRIADRAKNLGNAEEIQQKVDHLAHKHNLLEEKHEGLKAATQHASVLLKNNCLDSDPLPVADRKRISKRLATVIENFEDDPSSIDKGRDFNLLIKGLDKLTETSQQTVKDAWSEWVEVHYPSPNENLLNTVGTILPQKQATVDAIRAHLDALKNNKTASPTDQITWDNFEKHCHEAQDKYTKLMADFPEQVQQFCTHAADPQKGTPMDLLTEDVETWLRQHHLWDELRIHFK